MAKATMVTITKAVIQKTIEIKQTQKINLGDAIIAATALVHGFTIITRNINNFKNIPGLQVINPLQ